MQHSLPIRSLGQTGLDVSVLGLGGFHQVEVEQETVTTVVDRYLEAGGNYVETAIGYGNGTSEIKLGRALAGKRERVILASKSGAGTAEDAWRQINESLERLQTSWIDVYFFHGIGGPGTLDKIAGPGGALEGFERARSEGLIRHVAMSSHWPTVYVEAAKRLPIEVVLIWGNYLDFCNFPEIPATVLPFLRERGIGVLLMKPFADGFLYRSPRMALRYAFAQPFDCLVSGFNSVSLLETDLQICCDPAPVTGDELEHILRAAPELGDYVCRQCRDCTVYDNAAELKRVFELEGKADRQMDDRRPVDAAQYALRERLKGWFGVGDRAIAEYAEAGEPAPRIMQQDLRPCRYGIDVARKLRIAHAKLSQDERLELV